MPRPFKTNEVPVAPINLRTDGPLTLLQASTAVRGKVFRAANGSDPDKRATVDKDPCPHCGAQVEWVHTMQHNTKYVYARCRGATVHKWGFRGRTDASGAVVQSKSAVLAKSPKMTMRDWIEGQISYLTTELHKMQQLRELSDSLPAPRLSPM